MGQIFNQFKTVILLSVLTALMLFIGNFFGRTGFYVAIIFVVIMNLITYFFAHKIVLWMYNAKETKEKDFPKLYKMIREVSSLAKMPMPKVYLIPSEQSNAFACGRNPKHSSVAVTKGLIDLMNDEELKGVLAHEISHIKNRDILVMTVAGTIAGVISYIASMAQWAAIFGIGGDDDNGNFLSLILMAILAPILAMIIQLAISRSREYMADESAAKLLHNSSGLSSALLKLEKDSKKHPMGFGNESTAHLFISNPFTAKGMMSLLSTHPSIESRVQKLKAMKV